MSEIKPVYQLRYGTGDVEVTEEQYFRESYMRGTPRRMLYHAAAYEALKAENTKLEDELDQYKEYYEEMNEHYRALQFIESELRRENEIYTKKILELEKHVEKLGSGSRQHLYQAFARRYKEILSLRQENEKLKTENKTLEGLCAALNRAADERVEAQAKRIAELEEDLQFVERWANHHSTKPNVTAQEALSCIQHYPSIAEITKSYKDGVIPSTRNPYAEIEALRKQLKRDETLREIQTNEGSCSVACDQYPNCICPKNGDSK